MLFAAWRTSVAINTNHRRILAFPNIVMNLSYPLFQWGWMFVLTRNYNRTPGGVYLYVTDRDKETIPFMNGPCLLRKYNPPLDERAKFIELPHFLCLKKEAKRDII